MEIDQNVNENNGYYSENKGITNYRGLECEIVRDLDPSARNSA